MLRSEEVVMGPALWRFLEVPAAGVAAARYMFKSHRLNYARQCGKLLDAKYEKEHAYRLAHELLIKTNLNFISTELPAAAAKAKQVGDKLEAKPLATASPETSDDAQGSDSGEDRIAEAEAAALEMVRWAIANGGPSARQTFIQ